MGYEEGLEKGLETGQEKENKYNVLLIVLQ